MSYRLIDANALALNHKEVNDMPCIYADLPNGLDGIAFDEHFFICDDCAQKAYDLLVKIKVVK